MKVKLLVSGGNMKPGPAVAQQLGPLGINMGKLIEDVNAATASMKGMDVPVEVDVDAKTKEYKISVFSPGVSALLKNELKIEKGSGKPGSIYAGNIAFERIVKIAKTKQEDLLAKDLKSAIKLVVGSCVSLGILIDSKNAKEIEKDIEEGKYDKEIKGEITQASAEKEKELLNYFNKIKSIQDKQLKAEADAKAAEESKKS